MKKDVEQHTVLFHNRAREIFSSLYDDFKRSIKAVDRQRDENVFQQLQAKYTSELKNRLHGVASELIGQLSLGLRNGFNHVLHLSIEDYVHEFVQKIRSL